MFEDIKTWSGGHMFWEITNKTITDYNTKGSGEWVLSSNPQATVTFGLGYEVLMLKGIVVSCPL